MNTGAASLLCNETRMHVHGLAKIQLRLSNQQVCWKTGGWAVRSSVCAQSAWLAAAAWPVATEQLPQPTQEK